MGKVKIEPEKLSLNSRAKRQKEIIQSLKNSDINAFDDQFIIQYNENNEMPKKKKPWQQRPENWVEIAEHFLSCNQNLDVIVNAYVHEFSNCNSSQCYNKLRRWVRDLKSEKKLQSVGSKPSYGEEIDQILLCQIIDITNNGGSINADVMRDLLVVQLTLAGKESMLVENGGDKAFGRSWSQRFVARHNLGTISGSTRKNSNYEKIYNNTSSNNYESNRDGSDGNNDGGSSYISNNKRKLVEDEDSDDSEDDN